MNNTITRITYSGKFPKAAFLNEDIGFELSVTGNPGVSEILAHIEYLRKLAEQSHREKYPHLYTESGKLVTIEQVGNPEQDELIQKEFEETKNKIIAASSKAAAGQILVDSGFKMNLELKTLVNLKPE